MIGKMSKTALFAALAIALAIPSLLFAQACATPTQACSLSGTACCEGLACDLSSGAIGACCIPYNSSSYACSSNSSCCSGKCEYNAALGWRCVDLFSCNSPCASSLSCGAGCPYCANASGGGSAACRACIPANSTTLCAASSECCSGTCNPQTSTCESCLSSGSACSQDSDCCSTRCEGVNQSGTKVCVDAGPSCGLSGSPCFPSFSCCASPPGNGTLFCDYLNPIPTLPTGTGACRTCFPSGMACNATQPCCDSAYTCRTATPLGNSTYCLAPTGGSATYLFANWVKVGNASFTRASTPVHSGSSALQISGVSDSYIYNSALTLRNATTYSLEFWSRTAGSGDGVRYAVYDAGNDAYLTESGVWSFSPRASGYDSPAILSPGLSSTNYTRYYRAFTTLSEGVSQVQLRFYPPVSGTAYLDDLSIVESNDFSMLAWVKPGTTQTAAGGLFYKMGSENGERQGLNWSLSTSNTLTMGFYSSNSLGGINFTPQLNLSNNTWQLVGFTADRNGNYSAYLNGRLMSEGNFTPQKLNSSSPLFIGSAGLGGKAYLGMADEIRFYRRALSPAEMESHYNGIYQSACSASIETSYTASGVQSQDLQTSYNAFLRVRRQDPSAVLSLPFDFDPQSRSSWAIPDYSRSLLHGVEVSSNWTSAGRVGGAYNLTSGAVWIHAPIIAGTGDFTLSVWVRSYSNPFNTYILGTADKGNKDGIVLGTVNGYPFFYINANSIISSADVPIGRWTHVAAVRRQGEGLIYINCTEVGTSPGPFTAYSNWVITGGNLSGAAGNTGYFYVGSSVNILVQGTIFAYDGLVDEVRVFDRALSEDEICQLMSDKSLIYNNTLVVSGN